MKNISLVVFLVVGVLLVGSGEAASLRPGILGGAYDELIPEAVRGKTFVPSIKLRFEWDDNIYTTTELEKTIPGVSEQESWKLYVEPKIDVHWLSTTSYLGLGYQFSMIYYTDRAEDDTDMAHDLAGDLRHRFSPGVEIALRDIFRRSEEPDVAEQIVTAGGVRNIPYQRQGDYYYNQASAGLNLQASRQLWFNFNYANTYIDYDEGEQVIDIYSGQPRPGASYYYDRMTHSVGGRAQYIATPESKINAGVVYANIDYDADALRKDSQAWIGYVGLDQSLTKTAVASILAGWESRDFSDVDITEDSPYVDLSLASKIGKKGNGKVGYRYGFTETAYEAFGVEEAHTLYAGLTAWLANSTCLHVNTSYEMASFEANLPGRPAGESDEDAWLLGIVLRQHVHRNMYLEAGYRRTDIDSDYAGSEYERNRYFVGFGGIF